MLDNYDWSKHAPEVAGSLAAILFLREGWKRSIGYFLAGVATAHYAAPIVAQWTRGDQGVAGLLVGLFGMAVVAKVYEVIAAIKPAEVIERLRARWGL